MSAPVSTVDWKRCTSYVTIGVAIMEDGTFHASLTSYYGEPRKWRRHHLAGGLTDATLAPAGLTALQAAAQQALDAFWAGRLG